MRQHSPLAIVMLLHFHNNPVPFTGIEHGPQQDIVKCFLGNKIIYHESGSYRTTEKGRAFVNMILKTPFPVTKYVDPRTEEK